MGKTLELEEEQLTGKILGAAIEVHKSLGPGLLESVYQFCLARELSLQGLTFEREKSIPVVYKGEALDCNFRVDFLVESRVLVELKTIEAIEPVHKAQLLTYMRLAHIKVGLLINFNSTLLKNSIVRMVL
jgi:GxxExxY protein